MQVLVRVRARVRARRVRMSTEGLAVQQLLEVRRGNKDDHLKEAKEGWCDSQGTLKEVRTSRSPGGRRDRSPVREGTAERRAKIEQWNREREQEEAGNKNNSTNSNIDSDGHLQNGGQYYDDPEQQQQGGYSY